MEHIQIAGRKVGSGQPCFIIAEAGVNHNGDIQMAKRLVEAAARARADAVKFQTFKAESLVTPDAPKAEYQKGATARAESQFDMLRRLELSPESHVSLRDYCRQQGILFMSTPFDEESADLLDRVGVPVFKLPSGELTNVHFLAHVARKGKPMIVSTGMSTLAEVETAVRTVREINNQLVLLHCVSDYPANPVDANLRAMRTMADACKVPVGYSDHTPGIEVALAAVALGACVLEKHFTLDRTLRGPDHQASLEPGELDSLVRGVRIVEAALGHGRKERAVSEANTATIARKSIVAACDIPAGARLTEDMLTVKRPGTGLAPAMWYHLVGRVAAQDIPANTILTWEMVR